MILVNSVGKSFSGTNVLRDINIEVADSSVYGLVGYNGAGKTTLLNTSAVFTAPIRARYLPTWAMGALKPPQTNPLNAIASTYLTTRIIFRSQRPRQWRVTTADSIRIFQRRSSTSSAVSSDLTKTNA